MNLRTLSGEAKVSIFVVVALLLIAAKPQPLPPLIGIVRQWASVRPLRMNWHRWGCKRKTARRLGRDDGLMIGNACRCLAQFGVPIIQRAGVGSGVRWA